MEETYGIIYLITNTVNGKVYVGQTTKTTAVRWKDHCYKSDNGSPALFHNAIRKHGKDAFVIEQIDTAATRSELYFAEALYIQLFRSFRDYDIGYNGTSGGEFVEFTPVVRQKMSTSRKGKKRQPLSEETKKKISQKLMGVKHTEERRKNISKSLIGNVNGPSSEKNIQMLKEMGKRNIGNQWNRGKKQPDDVVERRTISCINTWEKKRAAGTAGESVKRGWEKRRAKKLVDSQTSSEAA